MTPTLSPAWRLEFPVAPIVAARLLLVALIAATMTLPTIATTLVVRAIHLGNLLLGERALQLVL